MSSSEVTEGMYRSMYVLGGIRSTGLFGWCICVYFVGVMVCVFEDHVLLGGVELGWIWGMGYTFLPSFDFNVIM